MISLKKNYLTSKLSDLFGEIIVAAGFSLRFSSFDRAKLSFEVAATYPNVPFGHKPSILTGTNRSI